MWTQSQPGPTADVNGSVTVCVWAHDRVRVRGHVHGRVIVHACACVPVGPQRECMPWRMQTRAYVDVGAGVGVDVGEGVGVDVGVGVGASVGEGVGVDVSEATWTGSMKRSARLVRRCDRSAIGATAHLHTSAMMCSNTKRHVGNAV